MASIDPLPPLIAAIQAGDLIQVRARLDAGADPNSGMPHREGDGDPVNIPVLYYACVALAAGEALAIVELLLQRGARTQDGESIYHAAQLNRVRCLALLLEYGADISSRQSPYGNTPLYFLVGHHDEDGGQAARLQGLRWLLDHGADPNVTSYAKQETPLHSVAAANPTKLATAQALLDHGADVNLARADGRTPYALARRNGNMAMAELLARHGAPTQPLLPLDEFLAACQAGDESAARAGHPRLMSEMTAEDRGTLTAAVGWENEAAVRLMTALGFDLNYQSTGGTALHYAAWRAQTSMVKLLLELGASIQQRDAQFGGSPLGWAAHGSGCHPGRDAAFCAVIDHLVAAGATHADACNRWGETPESMASPAVARHLRKIFTTP